MIEPIEGRGVNRAKGICDCCGREEVVVCDYRRQSGGAWLPDEGQAKRKLCAHGWAEVKGKLHCPKCEAARRAASAQEKPKEADVQKNNVAALRAPTREQKRQIIDLLGACYDTGRSCYKGCETDKTVAETLGGGVMPGWVADLREELYGPAGENEEMAALATEVNDWLTKGAEALRAYRAAMEAADGRAKALIACTEQVSNLSRRLEKIRVAVGPKAG